MNDIYLRKKKPAVRVLQQSFPRLLRRIGLWKIGIIAVILGYVMFGNRGVIQRVQLEVEKQRMIEEVEKVERETGELRLLLQKVSNDNDFIEKIARERYGMIRSGETIYRITEE